MTPDSMASNEAARQARLQSSGRRARPRLWVFSLVSFVAVLVLWETVARLAGMSRATGATILPDIGTTARSFIVYSNYWIGGLGAGDTRMGAPQTMWGATLGLAFNLGATLGRLLCGLAIGLVAGVVVGFLVSWSALIRGLLSFPVHFLRMMPLLALVPLFSMWFRDKNVGAVVFVAVAVFVLMFAATLNAVQNTSVAHGQYARSLGASPNYVYFRVVLPGIFPELRGGFLLSLGFSWNATLASEFLGQRYGIGAIVMNAQEFGRMDLIMLSAITCIVCAATSFLVADRVFSWLVRWAE